MAFKGVLFTAWVFIRFSLNNGSAGRFKRFCGVLCGLVLCVHAVGVPAILGALCGVLGLFFRRCCWVFNESTRRGFLI